MLLLLIDFLHHFFGFQVPAVFTYVSTRMLLAAITTLGITLFLGPWVIRWLYALKTGQTIRTEDCPPLVELHKKKKNTPTMGGILLLGSMVVALILWMDLTSTFTLLLLIVTLFLGGVGALDDYLKMKHRNAKGLSSKKKFSLQLILAAFVVGYLLFFPSTWERGKVFKEPTAKIQTQSTYHGSVNTHTKTLTSKEYMGVFFLPFKKGPLGWAKGAGLIGVFLFGIFVITGTSNAVNLADGLDGLASGLIVMVAAVLALFAFLSNHVDISRYLHIMYIEGSGEIAIYLFAMVGACLGFLWYNGYPAQVFMGDTGSLALGGILGASAVFLRREFLLALVGGVFVVEALSVIMQVTSYRYRNKKRIFLCTPLHHHFEFKGWPETKVVLRFWVIGFILAVIGVLSLKFQ